MIDMPQSTRRQMEEAIQRLGPFHHAIELPFGLNTVPGSAERRPIQRSRLKSLTDHAFGRMSEMLGGSFQRRAVLDVGCASGGFSVEAARRGAAAVLGIDVVPKYLEQARFVADSLGLRQVTFSLADASERDIRLPQFDVTFLFGLLYHLEDPIGTVRRLLGFTRTLVAIDTKVVQLSPGDNRAVWLMSRLGPSSHLDASSSLWRDKPRLQMEPSLPAVVSLLESCGFGLIEVVPVQANNPDTRYAAGSRVTVLARRKGPTWL